MKSRWMACTVMAISIWLGCSGGGASVTVPALLDTTVAVEGQNVTFASLKPTGRIFHLNPQKSPTTGDTLFSDAYVSALQCSLKVVSQAFSTPPSGGRLRSTFLVALLHADHQIIDSARLQNQAGADSGWIYNVAAATGKNTFAGKAILAAKGNRSFWIGIGVTPDSLATWKDRIEAINTGIHFQD